jgi:hypothetical protein
VCTFSTVLLRNLRFVLPARSDLFAAQIIPPIVCASPGLRSKVTKFGLTELMMINGATPL